MNLYSYGPLELPTTFPYRLPSLLWFFSPLPLPLETPPQVPLPMIILLQGKDQEDDYSERMLLEKQINFMAIRTFYGDRVQNVAYLLSLMGKELLPMSFGARHHR